MVEAAMVNRAPIIPKRAGKAPMCMLSFMMIEAMLPPTPHTVNVSNILYQLVSDSNIEPTI